MFGAAGCWGCCTSLLYSVLRCYVPGVSLTPQSTFVVGDLLGHGLAGRGSDEPLVLPIHQEWAVAAE